MTLELTLEEAQALINMIDICVKVKGLEAAEAGLILAKKIQEASKPKIEEKTKENVSAL